MKQNIVICILIAVIVVLLYIIFHPSPVTQRKTEHTSQIATQAVSEKNESAIETFPTNQANSSPLVPEFRINGEHNSNNFDRRVQSESDRYFAKREPQNYSYSYQSASEQNSAQPFKEPNIVPNSDEDTSASMLPQVPVVKRPKSLGDNLSICEPYKETMISELNGVKIKYDIEIVGWVRDKCVLNFETNMLDSGDSFENRYGFEPGTVEVVGFAPKVRCEFSRKQLMSVGDSFLLEEKKQNRKMLKDPNQIEFPEVKDMSFSDIKLLKILIGDRACKVVNANDFIEVFQSMFEF